MKTQLAIVVLLSLAIGCSDEKDGLLCCDPDLQDLSSSDGVLLDGFSGKDLLPGDAQDTTGLDQIPTDLAADLTADQTGDLAADLPGELPQGDDAVADLKVLEDLLSDAEEADTWFPDTVFEDTVQGSKCPAIGSLEALASDSKMNWAAAKQWCSDRSKRLADICELRSFVVGCPSSHSTGACGITTECTDFCLNAEKCGLCSANGGPGVNGCYISEGVSANCGSFWSSTAHGSWKNYAWMLNFESGFVFSAGTTGNGYALCVN